MRFKKFLPKILLIIGFLAAFLIIKYQSSIKDFLSFGIDTLKIYRDNFFYYSSSESIRHRPLSLIKKETELSLYIGEPFRDFTKEDWNWFWNLVYAAYPKKIPERESLPKRMRQLTLDEIAFELMSHYPQAFAYFKESHWKILFGIILGK